MTTNYIDNLAARLYQAVQHPDDDASAAFTCPKCVSTSYRITHTLLTWYDAGSLQIFFRTCGSQFIFGYNNVRHFTAHCTYAKRCCDIKPIVTITPDGWEDIKIHRSDSITTHYFYTQNTHTRTLPCTDEQDKKITAAAKLRLPKVSTADDEPMAMQELDAIIRALPEDRRLSFLASLDEVQSNKLMNWQYARAKRPVDKVDR